KPKFVNWPGVTGTPPILASIQPLPGMHPCNEFSTIVALALVIPHANASALADSNRFFIVGFRPPRLRNTAAATSIAQTEFPRQSTFLDRQSGAPQARKKPLQRFQPPPR